MSRIHVLEVPFEMRTVMRHLGAAYSKDLKSWYYKGDQLPSALEPFQSEDFSLERWKEDDLNKSIKSPQEGKAVYKPRPHQIEAGKKIDDFLRKGYRGFIEADDVGVGKSISTLLGAYAAAKRKGHTPKNPARLLIVCPKSSIPHWRNTLRCITFASIFRVVIINYESLPKLLIAPQSAQDAKRTRTKNKRIANQGKPSILWDIIIADEAHKMKNYQTAQRAKAFTRVARYADKAQHAPFVIWASATVGQNPLELGYLAPLIGQAKGIQGLTPDTWGQWLANNSYHVKKGKVGWTWIKPKSDNTDAVEVRAKKKQDIQRIRDFLFTDDFPSIRRLPENIAGWPTIQRIALPVELSTEQKKLYDTLWSQFRQFFSLKMRGRDPQGSLAQQLRFRQKSSLLLVDGVVDFALDMLDNGQQVAISVVFGESIDALKAKFEEKGYSCSEFSGRNVQTREQERLDFQKGKNKVIIYTVTEAVSFHAGEILSDGTKATMARRANIIMDVRYTALDGIQTEGRTHRDGQASNTYYVYGAGTVQEKIIGVMFERMAHMKTLSGDSLDDVEAIERLLDQESKV